MRFPGKTARLAGMVLAPLLVAVAGVALHKATHPAPAIAAVTNDTAAAVRASQAFLASLTPEQRTAINLPFDSPMKSHWHNFPPMMAKRPGLPFSALTPQQRELGFAVLRSVLGDYGYKKVTAITSADEHLGETAQVGFATGPNAYLMAIFGTPSLTDPWAIEYGGHHLGLNVAIKGSAQEMAPTLTGAYPNVYTKDGKEVFVLHDEVDNARKLATSLTSEQRAKAFPPMQIWNFVLGPGHDGQVVQPEGLKGSAMTKDQKAMLMDVVGAWVNVMNESAAKRKTDEIRQHIDDTYFLWSGNTTERGRAYFRVQGPTLWIEYSPQLVGGPGAFVPGGGPGGGRPGGGPPGGGFGGGGRPGGGPPPGFGGDRWPPPDLDMNELAKAPGAKLDIGHVHTVYRDFTDDYGSKLVASK
jgi:hypothetical protein